MIAGQIALKRAPDLTIMTTPAGGHFFLVLAQSGSWLSALQGPIDLKEQ
jgi:hypothetical protein